MARPLSVFFATIAAGGGHVATATALSEALHHHHPGEFTTRVSDVMAEFGAVDLDRRHKDGWRALLRRPALVRSGQRLTDAAPGVTRLSQRLLLGRFARELSGRLAELKPDLIVANHGWLTTVFALARARHGLSTPVVIFATEPFDASALWAEPASGRVLAPSLAAKEDLVRLGVPATNVRVVGYPVGQRFLAPPTQAEARARLGLPEGRFTALLSLGAEGLAGEATAVAERILASGSGLIAVAGRNAALKARLDELAERRPGLLPFGFTSDMPVLLAAADVVVGKAGPASTMEALAVGRPVLATAHAGLNELAVLRFLRARGVGGPVDVAHLADELAAWRDSPGRLAGARSNAAALDFAGMARRAAAHLRAAALGEQWPAEAVTGLPFEGTSRAVLLRRADGVSSGQAGRP